MSSNIYYTTDKNTIERLIEENKTFVYCDSFLPQAQTGSTHSIDTQSQAVNLDNATIQIYNPMLYWFKPTTQPKRRVAYIETITATAGYNRGGSIYRNEYDIENVHFLANTNESISGMSTALTFLTSDTTPVSKNNTPTNNNYFIYDFKNAFPKTSDWVNVGYNQYFPMLTGLNVESMPWWTTSKSYENNNPFTDKMSMPNRFGGFSMNYTLFLESRIPSNGVYSTPLYTNASLQWDNPLKNEFFADLYKDTREQMTKIRNGEKRLAVYRPLNGEILFNGTNISGNKGYLTDRVYYNIPITHNYAQALAYIQGGALPDDVEYYYLDLNNPPSGQDTTETDPLDDYDNDNGDNWLDTPINIPITTPTDAVSVNTYVVNNTELGNFIDWFWSTSDFDWSTIINSVTGLYGNLSQAIMSLKLFPFSISDIALLTNQSTMSIGRYSLEQTCKIVSGVNKVLDFGKVKINRKFNTFADYSPLTTIALYLPYHGFIRLDTNKYMKKELNIKASVDLITGTLQYMLFVNGTMLDTVACQVGVDIPFSLDNSMDIQKNIISTAIKTLPDAFAGNVLGAVSDLTTFSMPAIDTNSSASPCTSLWTYQKPFLIIQRPQYNRPDNYTDIYGIPCYKTIKLDTINGFTQIDNPIMTKDNKMTSTENDMIIDLLKKGIYL